jgi:hypothetical protein
MLWFVALSSCKPVDPVPAELRELRAGVEEAFERALVPDSVAVGERAATLAEQWDSFRPTAEEDGASSGALAGMDTALALLGANVASSVDSVVLGRACNGLLEWMDELFGVYGPPAPGELLQIGYLARQVWMDARNGDIPGAAAADLDEERAAWEAIKVEAVELGHDAAPVDAALEAQEDALEGQDTGLLQDASAEAVGAAAELEAAYE